RDRIVGKSIIFPEEQPISPEAQDIISSFCNADPISRLGSRGGAKMVKEHPFFRYVNWDDILNRRHKGPIVPHIRFLGDAQFFGIYPEEDSTKPSGAFLDTNIYRDEIQLEAWSEMRYLAGAAWEMKSLHVIQSVSPATSLNRFAYGPYGAVPTVAIIGAAHVAPVGSNIPILREKTR
ncbi:hypothetical protein F5883DRAFT_691372, partial [Diaporthe sp. PMI_573]